MHQTAPVAIEKLGKMQYSDYEGFRRMRNAGALVPIDDALLPRGGWLVNACEDGDRTPEAIDYLRSRACELSGRLQCTHLPLIVGGPAAAVPSCPFYELTYKDEVVVRNDKLLFARIALALKAKTGKIPNFANEPHCECGMCKMYSVSIWDNFLYSIACKDMVRHEFDGAFEAYAVLPHMDLTGYPEELEGPGAFRTYYLRRSIFEREAQRATSASGSSIL